MIFILLRSSHFLGFVTNIGCNTKKLYISVFQEKDPFGSTFTNSENTTMARRYDSSTTTFSPEGRLHQVEYAIEAINNAGTCVGILASDGIVMASERRVTSGLLAPSKVRSNEEGSVLVVWLKECRSDRYFLLSPLVAFVVFCFVCRLRKRRTSCVGTPRAMWLG